MRSVYMALRIQTYLMFCGDWIWDKVECDCEFGALLTTAETIRSLPTSPSPLPPSPLPPQELNLERNEDVLEGLLVRLILQQKLKVMSIPMLCVDGDGDRQAEVVMKIC